MKYAKSCLAALSLSAMLATTGCPPQTSAPSEPLVVVASNTGPVCEGEELVLTVSVVGLTPGAIPIAQLLTNPTVTYTVEWIGPGGFISNDPTVTIPFALPSDSGVYTVTVQEDFRDSLNRLTRRVTTTTTDVTVYPRATVSAVTNGPVCAGETLTLTATGNGAGSFLWSGPNGFSSSVAAPSIANATTAATGTYTVTFTNTNGCTATTTVSATVNPLPVITVGASSTTVCPGGTVELNSSSNIPGTTWLWSGPNGFSSTLRNPTIPNASVANSGTYTLTATSPAGCVSVGTVDILVGAIVTPVITTNSPILTGATLTLSIANVQQGVTYQWFGPLGQVNAGSSISYPSAASTLTGTWTVIATETATGCTLSDTQVVVVGTDEVTSNSPVCIQQGNQLLLFGDPDGMTQYDWYYLGALGAPQPPAFIRGGPEATDKDIVLTFGVDDAFLPQAAGLYVYLLQVTDATNQVATEFVVVNFIPRPAPFDPRGPAVVCPGATFTVNANAGPGVLAYAWSGPGIPDGQGAGPSITPTAPQSPQVLTYTVTAFTAGGCSETGTIQITVEDTRIVATPSNVAICSDGSAQVVVSTVSPATTISSASFVSPGGTVIPFVGIGDPTISFPVMGTTNNGTWQVTGTTTNGCPIATTFTVNVGEPPDPILGFNTQQSNPNQFAVGQNLTASLVPQNPAGTVISNWSLTGPNGLNQGGAGNPPLLVVISQSATAANAGVYIFTVTLTNGCSDAAEIELSVLP